MGLSEIVTLLAVCLALGFSRVSALYWHVAIVLLSLIFMQFSSLYWGVLAILWTPFAIKPLRQVLITKRLMQFFDKNIPAMSDTEREALEAGDVWWEAELFQGSPDWETLHAYPKPTLSDEEQSFLDNEVETLCGMLDDWAINTSQDKDLPPAIWEYLKTQGFFGMIIEKKYGGRSFSALAHSSVIAKIGSRSPTAAITAMVPNSLGPAELLHAYGTQTQKDYYLPRLAKGEEIPCFALTASNSGSDAATMEDYGIVCECEYQGQPTMGVLLNFDKRYITLAPVATLIGLAFRLYDPEKHLGDDEEIGITLCLIPARHPGVEVGSRHYPMGLPFMNGPIRGKDVFIPLEWVIGGPRYVGQGWKMLMNCLSTGRSISLPAISSAAAQLSVRTTGAYSSIRKQFNVALAHFEGVEALFAQMVGLNYIIGACRKMTAGAVDLGIKPSLVSAIAKYHTTEMSRTVVNSAMDIHGGRAIQTGPHNYLYSAYLGIPIGITVEGANILTRNLIVFGQGLMRCHPYLLNEMQLAKKGDLSAFDAAFTQHVGYTVSNAVRSFLLGLSGALCLQINAPKKIARYYKRLTRMSSALAFVSDVTIMLYGGQLKRKERTSARLGDVLSYLYLASCALKSYHDGGESEDELPSVTWACQYCLFKAQTALFDVIRNFPRRTLRGIVKAIVFPLGRRFKLPRNSLDRKIVKLFTSPSMYRDKLTEECYVGNTLSDVTGRVELTFEKLLSVDGLDRKFSQAVREGLVARYQSFESQLASAVTKSILTQEEADIYRDFVKMRDEVIAVDEFDSRFSYKEPTHDEFR